MWRVYARTEGEARELARTLLEMRAGRIEWVQWPMVATWAEVSE